MNTTNNKGAPLHGTPSKTPRGDSNSAHSQRQKLLQWLREHGVIDTITARRELDVMHPAARIMELKKRGHKIDTVWVERHTDCGKVHRVALYVLQPDEVAHG
jgi:hypothetical protein